MDPLPDYKQMTPEVRDRFVRLKRRPVIMEGIRVCKEFPASDGPRTVLKDVSFRLRHREFLSIIGPSGCGKSTLIRILAGLETATSGEILLDGKAVTKPGAERGMVFQKYTLFPWLTVCRNVMFGLETAGYSRDGAENMALQWLDIIGLEKYADYYPGQLSGGMQQRLQIARNLVTTPRLVFMDEPTGGLDVSVQARLLDLLRHLVRDMGLAVVLVTHDLAVARLLSHRLIVMYHGEVAETGLTDQVLDDPQHPYSQLLVSSILQC